MATIQNPQKPVPHNNAVVKDLPVTYVNQVKLNNPSMPLIVDTSDESSLLCYES